MNITVFPIKILVFRLLRNPGPMLLIYETHIQKLIFRAWATWRDLYVMRQPEMTTRDKGKLSILLILPSYSTRYILPVLEIKSTGQPSTLNVIPVGYVYLWVFLDRGFCGRWSLIKNLEHRKITTKFSIGNQKLRIETGRFYRCSQLSEIVAVVARYWLVTH